MTKNKLSRARMESAKLLVEKSIRTAKEWYIEDDGKNDRETIQAALEFLLNPEPTEAMFNAAAQDDRHPCSTGQVNFAFQSMMAELTKDDTDDRK